MTFHDDPTRLKHMLEAAGKAVAYCRVRERADLDRDELFSLAMFRLLEVIGEAARGVSTEFRAGSPQIPWREIIGTRNRLIHGYSEVNLDIVWSIIDQELPPLISELGKLIPPDSV